MKTSQDAVTRFKEKGIAVFTLGLREVFNEKHQKWKKMIDAPPKWQEFHKASNIVVLKKHNAMSES